MNSGWNEGTGPRRRLTRGEARSRTRERLLTAAEQVSAELSRLLTEADAMFDCLARQRLPGPATVPDDLFGLAVKWLFTGIYAVGPGLAAPGAVANPQ